MIKPLLILITLLVATQSYAQSVKFEFRAKESSTYPNLNNSSIFVTSSIPLFKTFRQGEIIEHENGIKFVTNQSLVVELKKNKDQVEQLMNILKKVVQTDKLKTTGDIFLGDKTVYQMGSIVNFVESVMIKHGFSVTIREKTKNESRGRDYDWAWEYYFFKP